MYDYIDYRLAIPTAVILWGGYILMKIKERRKARKAMQNVDDQ